MLTEHDYEYRHDKIDTLYVGKIYRHAEFLRGWYEAGDRVLPNSRSGLCQQFDQQAGVNGYELGYAMLGPVAYVRGLGRSGVFTERRYQTILRILQTPEDALVRRLRNVRASKVAL